GRCHGRQGGVLRSAHRNRALQGAAAVDEKPFHGRVNTKAKGKLQKAKGKNQGRRHCLSQSSGRPSASLAAGRREARCLVFCLLPFAVCLLPCFFIPASLGPTPPEHEAGHPTRQGPRPHQAPARPFVPQRPTALPGCGLPFAALPPSSLPQNAARCERRDRGSEHFLPERPDSGTRRLLPPPRTPATG